MDSFLKQQEVLKKQFTDRIASEWLDAAQKLREFVADQTNSTQRSCEEIFLPYCERVKKMCDQFFVHVDAMRGIVATNVSFCQSTCSIKINNMLTSCECIITSRLH